MANVEIGKELRTGSASLNGKEAVIGTAWMLIGANSRTVAGTVSEKLTGSMKPFPPTSANPVHSRTKLVDATIATVPGIWPKAAILVIVVLFILLG